MANDTEPRFFIGLDLGQAQDYTAIAILEQLGGTPVEPVKAIPPVRMATWPGMRPRRINDGAASSQPQPQAEPEKATYHVRHLERVPLGTLYPVIVEKVKAMLNEPELKKGSTQLVADATGVGRPIVDMLRAAGLQPLAVTITGGDTVTTEGGFTRVPKRDLVGVLQVALQTGRLKFNPGMPEVNTFVQEALSFQVKITTAANDTYGSWREGAHDDLVLAGALALWQAERTTKWVIRSLAY
jgi:hypothetical protein